MTLRMTKKTIIAQKKKGRALMMNPAKRMIHSLKRRSKLLRKRK
jgi:hypothetical protein